MRPEVPRDLLDHEFSSQPLVIIMISNLSIPYAIWLKTLPGEPHIQGVLHTL